MERTNRFICAWSIVFQRLLPFDESLFNDSPTRLAPTGANKNGKGAKHSYHRSEDKAPVVPGGSSGFSDGRCEVLLFSLEVHDHFSFLRTISRGSLPQRASRLRA